jgi:hypothetical protein
VDLSLPVVLGFALFSQLDPSMLRLRHTLSSIYLLVITLAASTAAGFVGMIANPALFQRDAIEGFFFWFINEFVNYLAVLPLMSVGRQSHRIRRASSRPAS